MAMQHTKRATEIDPKSGAALANYGVVLDAVGDSVGAERAFLSALEITGDQPGTLLNLGQNLLSQNRGKEAQEVLQRLTKVSDTSLTRKRLGDAYALQGLAAEAIEQYESSLRIDPNYFPAMNDAGRVMIQRYRTGLELEEPLRQAAIAYWQRSLKVNPKQPQIEALLKQWERGRP
jgi:tetratricopeptide (TPR) repeat protein